MNKPTLTVNEALYQVVLVSSGVSKARNNRELGVAFAKNLLICAALAGKVSADSSVKNRKLNKLGHFLAAAALAGASVNTAVAAAEALRQNQHLAIILRDVALGWFEQAGALPGTAASWAGYRIVPPKTDD